MTNKVEVIARKAFRGAEGWVKRGQKLSVTEPRKRDLEANGLIEGSKPAGGEDAAARKGRTQKLHITGGEKPAGGEDAKA